MDKIEKLKKKLGWLEEVRALAGSLRARAEAEGETGVEETLQNIIAICRTAQANITKESIDDVIAELIGGGEAEK